MNYIETIAADSVLWLNVKTFILVMVTVLIAFVLVTRGVYNLKHAAGRLMLWILISVTPAFTVWAMARGHVPNQMLIGGGAISLFMVALGIMTNPPLAKSPDKVMPFQSIFTIIMCPLGTFALAAPIVWIMACIMGPCDLADATASPYVALAGQMVCLLVLKDGHPSNSRMGFMACAAVVGILIMSATYDCDGGSCLMMLSIWICQGMVGVALEPSIVIPRHKPAMV